MKCPKTDVLENILDKINIELDNDMRGNKVAMSGAISMILIKKQNIKRIKTQEKLFMSRDKWLFSL
jgi:hypothetical protein